jgi:hypothetical protein
MRLAILLLLAHLSQPSPEFQLNIQHGGSPFDKSENKGSIDYSAFIKLLDQYPWLDEIDKANANQKSSPTLTVMYTKGMKNLWVSMSGDRTNHGYLVGYTHIKFMNGKTVKWLEIYLPDDKEKVKSLYALFYEKEFDALEKELSHLEKFKEMESQK